MIAKYGIIYFIGKLDGDILKKLSIVLCLLCMGLIFYNSSKLAKTATLIQPSNGIDDTRNIETVINTVSANGGGDIRIPDGTYLINGTSGTFVADGSDYGLKMKSNIRLIFSKNAKFKVITNNSEWYNVINIKSCDNVEIINPNIEGDTLTHIGTTGEWGHGITILNSNNITIEYPNISNCWGDGIYIGSEYTTVNPKRTDNIKIIRPIIDGVRRNGISVCTGGLIEIIEPHLKNINGTAPKSGIDIEPEGGHNPIFLENLKIIRPITENCGNGISSMLNGLGSQETHILIDGHNDIGSNFGFSSFVCSANVKGTFVYKDAILKNNLINAIVINGHNVDMMALIIKNPTIIDCNYLGNTHSQESTAIVAMNEENIEFDTGNIEIEKPTIIDTRTPKLTQNAISLNSHNIKKVKIINPKQLDNTVLGILINGSNSLVKDGNNILEIEDTYEGIVGIEIGNYNYMSKRKNTNALGTIYYNLENVSALGEVTFEVSSNHAMIIHPFVGMNILPLSTTGQSITSSTIGSKITLKSIGGGNWRVENIVGTWKLV